METAARDIVRFQPASDQSLLVYLGDRISVEPHQRVRKLLHLLQSRPIAGVRDLHPAYCSILVDFDALQLTHSSLQRALDEYTVQIGALDLPEPRNVEIPTCYGGEFGPDLDEVAHLHSLTPSQVVELHSSVSYRVYFLGFVPGFAYLGELPGELATPRLATPRRSTPAGSVGIADNQTGVYPFATPGGWRVIGRTPLAMFRPDRANMSLLATGDRVRFAPVSGAEFAALCAV
jgi:inhibitor of KinA